MMAAAASEDIASRNAQKLEAELRDIILNNIKENIDKMSVSDKTFFKISEKITGREHGSV